MALLADGAIQRLGSRQEATEQVLALVQSIASSVPDVMFMSPISFAENPGHSLKHQTSSRNLQPYVTMCNHGSASSNEAQKGPFGSLRHIDRGRTSAERLLCCCVATW